MESNRAFAVKAERLEEQASKTMKGSFFGNFFSSKTDRSDQELEYFQQAANCYKMAGDNDGAIRMFMKRIECEESDRDKAECYKEMSRIYKESDVSKFLEYSQKAIALNRMAGRQSAAAQLTKECAQVLEENYEYEQAADWYA